MLVRLKKIHFANSRGKYELKVWMEIMGTIVRTRVYVGHWADFIYPASQLVNVSLIQGAKTRIK